MFLLTCLLWFYLMVYWPSVSLESKQLEVQGLYLLHLQGLAGDAHIASTRHIFLNKFFISMSIPPKRNSRKTIWAPDRDQNVRWHFSSNSLFSCLVQTRRERSRPHTPVSVMSAACCALSLGAQYGPSHTCLYTLHLRYDSWTWEWKSV